MATETLTKMAATTRILLVEDDEDDYLLTAELLEQLPELHFSIDWARTRHAALDALGEQCHDVVLLDYRLGSHCGLDVLAAARAQGYDVPVIMLTGQANRDMDIAAMKAGATDYLVKGELDPWLIERAVRYALEGRRLRSELASAAQRLHQREAQLRTVMEQSIVGILVTDRQGEVLFANPMAETFLGRSAGDMLGSSSPVGIEPGRREIGIRVAGTDAAGGTGELFVQSIRWGERPALLATIMDVTARKRAEEQLVHQARRDELTGLANRAMFQEYLARALGNVRRSGKRTALLFLDLDRFKQVNDRFGHDAGDALIRGVAGRVADCMRGGDLVARLGGDEFAVILWELEDVADAGRVADKILQALQAPFHLGGHEIQARTSIGIAACPDDATDSDALVKAADTAMYEAKRLGRNNYQYFSPTMQEAAVIRSILEFDLNHALRDGLFELYYQPKFASDSQRVVGAEALLRWHHERRGLLEPGDFIEVAEDSGLIVPIGRWVIRHACSQIRAWRSQGLDGDFSVSVNVSLRQFLRDDVAGLVLDAIASSGIDPHDFEIELTESTLIEDFDTTLRSLQALHDGGVRIAIDDFGTGHSSLQRLCRLPIDSLKIDRSFVESIGHNPAHEIIVKSTIDLAHNLGLKVIAEGVEIQSQAEYLQAHHCDQMQGFLLGRPVPIATFDPLLPRLGHARAQH